MVNFIHDAKIATISRFNDIFFTLESREELFKSWTKYEFDLEGWPKSSLLFIYLFSFRKYRPKWPSGRVAGGVPKAVAGTAQGHIWPSPSTGNLDHHF